MMMHAVRDRIVTGLVLAGLMAGVPPAVRAQSVAAKKPAASAKPYVPPRTAWGDPDLQGIYTNKDESGIPFERPNEFAGRRIEDITDTELTALIQQRNEATVENAADLGIMETGAGPTHWYENFDAKNSRPWMVIDPADGKIPAMLPEAQSRIRALPPQKSSFGAGPWNSPADFSLYERCITRGIPGSMMPAIYGNSYQIVQGPGYVGIRYEMIHETRVVPTDARPHLSSNLRPYLGDARGHWDGNTLVVETTNFNPRTTYRNASSDTFKLIERFTLKGPDKMEWAVTIDDPKTWTRPWTFAMTLTKDGTQMPYRVRLPRRELRDAEHPAGVPGR